MIETIVEEAQHMVGKSLKNLLSRLSKPILCGHIIE
jgi:hypothetical protein